MAVEQRIERNLLGDQVEQFNPRGFLCFAVRGREAFAQQVLHLVVGLAALPVHALLSPGVGRIPPAHQQIGVIAEDRGVTGGHDDVVGIRVSVNRVVDVGPLALIESDVDAQ